MQVFHDNPDQYFLHIGEKEEKKKNVPCLLILLNMLHLVRYKENIVIDPGSVDIFPPMRVPNNLHHLVKPIYRSSKSFGSISSMKEKGFRLMTDADSLSSILQYTSDDEVNNSVVHDDR